MKLFDKYLLACTNQKIPMPAKWQGSFDLELTSSKQVYEPNSSELTGYRFQQDETLERGYVKKELESSFLDEENKYLIHLYLQAIKEHRELDFSPYYSLGTTIYSFPKYITTSSIIDGECYTLYGSTIRPSIIKLYSEATGTVYYEEEVDSFNLLAPKVLSIDSILQNYKYDSLRPGLTVLSAGANNYVFSLQLPATALVSLVAVDITSGAGVPFIDSDLNVTSATANSDVTAEEYTGLYLSAGEWTLNGRGITINGITYDSINIPYLLCVTFYSIDKQPNTYVFNLYDMEDTFTGELHCVDYSSIFLDYSRIDNVDVYKPTITDDALYYSYTCETDNTIGSQHEYLKLEIQSYSKIAILQGSYPHLPIHERNVDSLYTASTQVLTHTVSNDADPDTEATEITITVATDAAGIKITSSKVDTTSTELVEEETAGDAALTPYAIAVSGVSVAYYPVLYPSLGVTKNAYADKLIPCLLDMEITSESPSEEKELLENLSRGSSYAEKIKLNTDGIYDIDEFIGNKLVW